MSELAEELEVLSAIYEGQLELLEQPAEYYEYEQFTSVLLVFSTSLERYP